MGPSKLHRWHRRVAVGLAAAVATVAASAGSALGAPLLTPGAVFTETNSTPHNFVLAFNRSADGKLTPAGQFDTGGAGRQGNPPLGFPTLDSAGPVELSGDGDNRSCLFAVNAGSGTVSSFRVRPSGLELADQQPTGGTRPISVTSTTRGPGKQLLYVLNSDTTPPGASIQGYYVSGSCGLTQIPGSFHLTSSPDSIPAQIRFDRHGRVLAVSERFANGTGDIDIFPVDEDGVAGAPVINSSAGITPYGLDWNNQDILAVSNENVPVLPGSSVTTYELSGDGMLTPLATAPSPGAACWNVFTNNGKFLYVTKPAAQRFAVGPNVDAFRVGHDGSLTLIDSQPTNHNALDDALSHDSRFLYVLSVAVLPPAPASAINEFAIDPGSGTLTAIGAIELPGSNSTAGLAAW